MIIVATIFTSCEYVDRRLKICNVKNRTICYAIASPMDSSLLINYCKIYYSSANKDSIKKLIRFLPTSKEDTLETFGDWENIIRFNESHWIYFMDSSSMGLDPDSIIKYSSINRVRLDIDSLKNSQWHVLIR